MVAISRKPIVAYNIFIYHLINYVRVRVGTIGKIVPSEIAKHNAAIEIKGRGTNASIVNKQYNIISNNG